MELLKIISVPIVSVLIITLLGILFPDFVYEKVKNDKVNKFLEHDLIKAIWILLTVFACGLLIIGYIYLLFDWKV